MTANTDSRTEADRLHARLLTHLDTEKCPRCLRFEPCETGGRIRRALRAARLGQQEVSHGESHG